MRNISCSVFFSGTRHRSGFGTGRVGCREDHTCWRSGGKDYVTIDPQTHRLYVARGSRTNVMDTDTGKVIADILGQGNSHGVAIVPSAGRGFFSGGGADRKGGGAIVILDLKMNAVLGKITSMGDSDCIIYDPFSKLVLIVSGDGSTLQTLKPDVDPKTAVRCGEREIGQAAFVYSYSLSPLTVATHVSV